MASASASARPKKADLEVPEGVDPVKHWRSRIILWWIQGHIPYIQSMNKYIYTTRGISPYFRYYGGFALNTVLGHRNNPRLTDGEAYIEGLKGFKISDDGPVVSIPASDIDIKLYYTDPADQEALAVELIETLNNSKYPFPTKAELERIHSTWIPNRRMIPFLKDGQNLAVLTFANSGSPIRYILARLFSYRDPELGEQIQIQFAVLMQDSTFLPLTELTFAYERLPDTEVKRIDPTVEPALVTGFPSLPELLEQFQALYAFLGPSEEGAAASASAPRALSPTRSNRTRARIRRVEAEIQKNQKAAAAADQERLAAEAQRAAQANAAARLATLNTAHGAARGGPASGYGWQPPLPPGPPPGYGYTAPHYGAAGYGYPGGYEAAPRHGAAGYGYPGGYEAAPRHGAAGYGYPGGYEAAPRHGAAGYEYPGGYSRVPQGRAAGKGYPGPGPHGRGYGGSRRLRRRRHTTRSK